MSRQTNFIFQVLDSCLIMIENLILKRTNIKDGTGVSGEENKRWHCFFKIFHICISLNGNEWQNQLYISNIRILFNAWKLNFEEKTDIKDGTGVSQDGNIVIIYISSYCSFSVDWLIC